MRLPLLSLTYLAPQVGIEPTNRRLTVGCPTLGPLRNNLGPNLFTNDAQATSDDVSLNVVFGTLEPGVRQPLNIVSILNLYTDSITMSMVN